MNIFSRKRFIPAILITLFFLAFILPVELFQYGIEPYYSKNGMVVSTDVIANRVGVEVLKRGGNAVDAAIAVGFALAVVYPSAGNIGGGGFMMIRTADDNSIYALDYRETAPRKASRDMYIKTDGTVDKDKLLYGYLACGVPGTVRGFEEAHGKFGKLKWNELIEPAIKLAEEGFPLSYATADSINARREYFARFPSSSLFIGKGDGWNEGDVLIQKDLAQTLKRIASEGAGEFYTGRTADLLVKAVCAEGGIISREDLAGYRAIWREPLKISHFGYDIYIMPPPGSGGIVMAEVFNILEHYDIRNFQFGSADYYHILAESAKFAFKDRAVFLGDPDFIKIPLHRLLSREYIQEIVAKISMTAAIRSNEINEPIIPLRESKETTHYTVVDRWGNVVSNTYTLNSSYGSKAVASGTGILLNNEMDDFTAQPGTPNQFGLIGSEANAIEPGKRMLSSMTPVIIMKDDVFFMALGSPGGPYIISSVLQTIINVLVFDMNLQEAVNAPRIHHQWIPDFLEIEKTGFAPEVISDLVKRGHVVKQTDYWGDVQAIMYIREKKIFAGASDPRKKGIPIGY